MFESKRWRLSIYLSKSSQWVKNLAHFVLDSLLPIILASGIAFLILTQLSNRQIISGTSALVKVSLSLNIGFIFYTLWQRYFGSILEKLIPNKSILIALEDGKIPKNKMIASDICYTKYEDETSEKNRIDVEISGKLSLEYSIDKDSNGFDLYCFKNQRFSIFCDFEDTKHVKIGEAIVKGIFPEQDRITFQMAEVSEVDYQNKNIVNGVINDICDGELTRDVDIYLEYKEYINDTSGIRFPDLLSGYNVLRKIESDVVNEEQSRIPEAAQRDTGFELMEQDSEMIDK